MFTTGSCHDPLLTFGFVLAMNTKTIDWVFIGIRFSQAVGEFQTPQERLGLLLIRFICTISS